MRPNQVSERSPKLKSAARIGPNGRLFFYTCDETTVVQIACGPFLPVVYSDTQLHAWASTHFSS